MKITFVLVISLAAAIANACKPVLIVHGVLQLAIRVEPLANFIRTAPDCPNGRNVTVLYVADGIFSFVPMWQQVKLFHDVMRPYFNENPDGIHVIGYSQGTLISRAVIQLTDNHNVHTLVSLAGIHMGLSGWPILQTEFLDFNQVVKPFNDSIAWRICYTHGGQTALSLCNYWRDEVQMDKYIEKGLFLPIINNEVPHNDSARYKKNLIALKKFVMISSRDDELVSPWQSGLFASRAPDRTIIPMEEQPIYKSDVLGLKTLHDRGDLLRFNVSGLEHISMTLSSKLCYKYITPYLD